MSLLSNHANLKPRSLDSSVYATGRIETGATKYARDVARTGRPFVNVGLGFDDVEAGLCQKIAERHRAPTIKMVVNIAALKSRSERFTRNDKYHLAPQLEFRAQSLKLSERMLGMFEGVVRNDDVCAPIGHFRNRRKDLNATPQRRLSCSRVYFDAYPANALKVSKQKTAAASEIENRIGRLNFAREFREIGPAAELPNALLPSEVGGAVMRRGISHEVSRVRPGFSRH
jgi:hypothetical protein